MPRVVSDIEYTKFFDFEMKAVDEKDGSFEGYASTFGNRDLQSDIVMRGAFARTLKESKGKVPVLMGHQMSRIVGFGTHAEEDDKGLLVRGEFTLDSDEGRNAYATTRHAAAVGHKFGLSIGYGIAEGGYEIDERRGVRKLTDVDLYEYSLAAIPANTRARMTRVKAAGEKLTVTEIEDILREQGFSRADAKRIISDCKALRDAGPDEQTLRDAAAAGDLRCAVMAAQKETLMNLFREVRCQQQRL